MENSKVFEEILRRFGNEVIEDFDECFSAVTIPSNKDDDRLILIVTDTGDEDLWGFFVMKNPKKIPWTEELEDRIGHCFLVGGMTGRDGKERAVRICKEEGKAYLYYYGNPITIYEFDIEEKE